MSDGSDIPRRLGGLFRWMVANLAWILVLVAIEQLGEGSGRRAIWFGIAAAVDIGVGAQLHIFASLFRRLKRRVVGRDEPEPEERSAPYEIWEAVGDDCPKEDE